MERIAVFPGSFDPFTIGHKAIVDKALPLFDKIIIAIGVNSEKNGFFTPEKRLNYISGIYKDNPRIEVKTYSSLTVSFVRKIMRSLLSADCEILPIFSMRRPLRR